jgi:serine/threonine protein kinase
MDRLINQILRDRYQINSLLGRKTGRRTFLANDLQTRSPVVIKLLLFDPDFIWDDLKLFEREIETLKSLDRPAIPKYLDSFEVDTEIGKGFALVQSYIEARSLQEWVQSGRSFSEEELRVLAKELLQILDYLHKCQPPVIHRDIKPSNILLGDRSGNHPGTIYLVDFGSVQTAVHGGTITVVGTYGYMPPEQFGGKTTPASDLYGLGATLIYLLTRIHPADLPIRNGRIRFEAEGLASEQFQTWLRYLIQPDANERWKSARIALAALQCDRFILPVPTAIAKPSGSRVTLTKTDERLEIVIPPFRIKRKLGVIHSTLWLSIFCCIPLLLGFWIPVAGFLVVPFVLWVVSSIWINAIYSVFEKLQLSIDSTEICLTHDWLGIKKRSSSPTQDILKLERLRDKKFLFSRLNIWAGNQCYSLEKFNTTQDLRRLTEIELDWLAFELSDWLDLPIQSPGEVTTPEMTNMQIDSRESALSISPISSSELPRISRPANAVCTVTKRAETIEISAPAGYNSLWGVGGCLVVFLFFLMGGATIVSPLTAAYLGTVLVSLWWLDGWSNKCCQFDRIVLRIDRQEISLWKYSQAEQWCLNKMSRSTIQKLRLVYTKSNERTSYHVGISTTRDRGNALENSFLVGNRSFWLSQKEAEWLAYELSNWLKLPVTEVEVINNSA